ncbi:MAG: VTT domain-containing protein [Parcubacteria group bacterium]
MDPLKPEGESTHDLSWKDILRSAGVLLVIIGAAYFLTSWIDIEELRTKVSTAGLWGPIIVVLLKASSIVVVPIGGTPIYPLAGALFGFWEGLLWTMIGDALGATIAFYLSRHFGLPILRFFVNKNQMPAIYNFIERGVEIKVFFKTRLFFIGLPDIFAYAAGLTKVSYPLFIFAYISVHSVFAGLLVAFGDIIVSAGLYIVIGAGLLSLLLAVVGAWLLKLDLTRSA